MTGNNPQHISSKAVHFLKEYGPTVLKNGYAPIPVKTGSKVPAISSWQKTKATQADLDSWSSNPSLAYGLMKNKNHFSQGPQALLLDYFIFLEMPFTYVF